MTGRTPSEQPGLLLYVMVDSVADSVEAVLAHGGHVVQPIGVDAPEIPRASATLPATSSPSTRSPTPSDAADAACRLLDRPDEGWHCRGAIRAGWGLRQGDD